MGKRGGRLVRRFGPQTAADIVVERFINEARLNLATWAQNYQSNIQAYLANAQRQNEAKQKLATWYSILLQVAGQIASAMARAKELYAQALKAGAPPVPAAPTAPQVQVAAPAR